MRLWPLLAGILAISGAHAEDNGLRVYYHRHAEGWFWYQDPTPPQTPADPQAQPPEPDDPLERMTAFQKQVEIAKARAILEPTDDNVKDYLQLNQLAMNRAGEFAQAWQRVVWTTPGLDTRLTHPVNDQAVQVFNDEKLRRVDDFLADTARTHGLFFFFKGSCPFCHRFAPVLKAFAESYGFRIVPISLDGGALPDFPTPRSNADIAEKLKVDTVPAVFLVNPKERTLHPVAFGYVSDSELRQRIYTLMSGQTAEPLVQAQLPGDLSHGDE